MGIAASLSSACSSSAPYFYFSFFFYFPRVDRGVSKFRTDYQCIACFSECAMTSRIRAVPLPAARRVWRRMCGEEAQRSDRHGHWRGASDCDWAIGCCGGGVQCTSTIWVGPINPCETRVHTTTSAPSITLWNLSSSRPIFVNPTAQPVELGMKPPLNLPRHDHLPYLPYSCFSSTFPVLPTYPPPS